MLRSTNLYESSDYVYMEPTPETLHLYTPKIINGKIYWYLKDPTKKLKYKGSGDMSIEKIHELVEYEKRFTPPPETAKKKERGNMAKFLKTGKW